MGKSFRKATVIIWVLVILVLGVGLLFNVEWLVAVGVNMGLVTVLTWFTIFTIKAFVGE